MTGTPPGFRGLAAAVGALLLVSGCSSVGTTDGAGSSSPTGVATQETGGFPVEVFQHLREEPVSAALAADLQQVLDAAAEPGSVGGTTATVVTPYGSWSGASGLADDVRALSVDDQFAIASITKTVVAAQVMQLVESGDLDLDDPVDAYLPDDLGLDTNGATVRQLLGHRSGIPGEDWSVVDQRLLRHPQASWTTDWLLDLVPTERSPAGDGFEYANANYVVLGRVLEHVRRQPLAEVLRNGVLVGPGLDRLVFQPQERTTEPRALPAVPELDGMTGSGVLPFPSAASTHGGAAAMASDAPSLARWWRALCAGEVVSALSVAEMSALTAGYGLGLYSPDWDPEARGHGGEHVANSYVSWAGCVPRSGTVVVVLSTRPLDAAALAGRLEEVVRAR